MAFSIYNSMSRLMGGQQSQSPSQNLFLNGVALVVDNVPVINQLFSLAVDFRRVVETYVSSVRCHSVKAVQQFNEMTIPRAVSKETSRRLIEQEKAASVVLASQLSAVTNQEILQLVEAIERFDFAQAPKDSILLNPKLPYIALEALRSDMLDPKHGQAQVATILNFWAALRYHGNPSDLQTISVFDSKAAELIKQTLKNASYPTVTPFLEGAKFEEFIQKMGLLPASEQRFLLVPDIQGDLPLPLIARMNKGDVYQATISQATKSTGINVFNRLNDQGRSLRMIPSAGMMQAFLDAQYGSDAVVIKPRTYLSTLSHVMDTRLNDTCDMMVPTPDDAGNSRCPSTADGYQAPWYDFPYHDFYHSITTSTVGKIYRRVGITAAKEIRAFAKKVKAQEKAGINQLAVGFIDMEYYHFHHFLKADGRFSPECAFWQTINLQLKIRQLQVKANEHLKRAGIESPLRADRIEEEMETKLFKSLYRTFVQKQKGPVELNEESFKKAVLLHKKTADQSLFLDAVGSEGRRAMLNEPICRKIEHLNESDDEYFPFEEDLIDEPEEECLSFEEILLEDKAKSAALEPSTKSDLPPQSNEEKAFSRLIINLIYVNRITDLKQYKNDIVRCKMWFDDPVNLAKLSHVDKVWFNGVLENEIYVVPDQITKLKHLTLLSLTGTHITDVPDGLSQLSSLSQLELSDIAFPEVPPSVFRLTQLKVLYLASNKLSSISEEIGALNQLTELDLAWNRLREVPRQLTHLSRLETLRLSANPFLGVIPEEVCTLTQLKRLFLDRAFSSEFS
jgi:Leucine-rich repeat (LRR) protein